MRSLRQISFDDVLSPEWPITVIAMLLYAELFVALAIWRFAHEEF